MKLFCFLSNSLSKIVSKKFGFCALKAYEFSIFTVSSQKGIGLKIEREFSILWRFGEKFSLYFGFELFIKTTFGPSPRFESSLLVNVLLVSMPESFVVESWLPCRSLSHRENSSESWPSKRTVFFLRSVNRRLSPAACSSTYGSMVSLK
jgi:hypothetical protein